MNKLQLHCWLYILLGFYLTGCMPNKKVEYEKVKHVSLDLAFIPEKINFFYHKDSLCFYAYNFSTYKKLEIYTDNGKIINAIDLSKLKTEKIKVKINSLDSIYVFTHNPSSLYVLNRKGIILKVINIDSLIYQKTEYNKKRCKYLNAFFHEELIKNKDIFLGISIIDTSYNENQDLYNLRLAANIQSRKNPNLAYIKNVLDTNCTILFEPLWIGKTIKEEDDDFNMIPNYMHLEHKIVFFIPHDRHIYFINPNNLSFEQKIPIYSEYTELEYKKPKLTKEGIQTQKKPYVFYAMYKGAILSVCRQKNKYYVLIKHETPLPEKEEMISLPDRFDTPYSIIKYDKEWKKEKEVLLPAQEKFISFLANGQFITQAKTKNPRNIILNFYQWTK